MDQARVHATRALRLASMGRGRRGTAQHLAGLLLERCNPRLGSSVSWEQRVLDRAGAGDRGQQDTVERLVWILLDRGVPEGEVFERIHNVLRNRDVKEVIRQFGDSP